ncbi:unnamed protein product, partial [Mesorhabditis belari]|uniref:SWI/SNF-related matrix-associated actin-dependent regulator of chromatin subfamily A containing DEAD/H box 1 n=1 Tax=Mesorhabditis belari TaxID=2138241 RepID=A0AAF3EBP6_9BILA
MSSSKFGPDSSDNRRIAHRAPTDQRELFESLAYKKAKLASFSHSLNSGGKQTSMKSFVQTKNVTNGKKGFSAKRKSKKDEESDEEDDFIVQSNEEESEFTEEDEEEPVRKRKLPNRSKATPQKAAPLTPQKAKAHTLSESSSEGDEMADGWLCKPRLNKDSDESQRAPLKRPPPSPNKQVKRRVVTLSEESDDAQEAEITNAATLRKVAKQAAKHTKKNGKLSDSDYEDDADFDAGEDFIESFDSEDSDDGRQKRPENRMKQDCVRFFNTASHDDLLLTPRINEKLADVLLANRPFDTFRELEETLSSHRGGKPLIESYMEYLENRGVLNRILDDCKGDSAKVAAEFKFYQNSDNVPDSLNKSMSLHAYQKEGLNWLVMMHEKKLNCILGDEMGLGKTIQIVAFLAWLKEQNVPGPHLIIVPSSTIENWMNEMSKWCPDIQVDVLLSTYNMVGSKSDDKKFFKNFKINYVIYDEGHMLKNCSTERYKSLMKIKSSRKILLTGTPLQNNLIELISLMYFVMRKIFDRYCDNITQLLSHFKQQGGSAIEGTQALYQQDRIEQAKAILEPYILRRLKCQVLNQLPKKTEEVATIKMEAEQADLYDYQMELLRSVDDSSSTTSSSIMRLRQAANHPLMTRRVFDDDTCTKVAKKLVRWEKEYGKKRAEDVAEDLLCLSDYQIHKICEKFSSTSEFCIDDSVAIESGKCKFLDQRLPPIKTKGEKVLIFSQFTQMLDILEAYLRVRGHSFCRMDGSTPVMERQDMINSFNHDPSLFVFLLSTRAGGLGINLTSANHIFIHDIDFNPYNDKQAEDRCHRMGQEKPVHVVRMISKGTIEEGIARLAKRKLQLEKEVTIGTRGAIEADDSLVSNKEGESETELEAGELADLMKQVKRAKPTSPKKRRDSQ